MHASPLKPNCLPCVEAGKKGDVMNIVKHAIIAATLVLFTGTAMAEMGGSPDSMDGFHALSNVAPLSDQNTTPLTDAQLDGIVGGWTPNPIDPPIIIVFPPRWPWPWPGPVCLSCPYPVDSYKDQVINPQYTTALRGNAVMFNPQPEPPGSLMPSLTAR